MPINPPDSTPDFDKKPYRMPQTLPAIPVENFVETQKNEQCSQEAIQYPADQSTSKGMHN